jgi:chromosome segregation ATPase
MKINSEIRDKITIAANSLVAEGIESPTNDQVRERMGGGSLSHISPVMREWRDARKVGIAATLDMPDELKKAITTALGQLWATASKLAATSFEIVQQEAESAKAAIEKERGEALSRIDILERQVANKDSEISTQAEKISTLEAALEASRSAMSNVDAHKRALEFRIEDRDREIAGLKEELAIERSEMKTLQGELVKIAKGNKAQK